MTAARRASEITVVEQANLWNKFLPGGALTVLAGESGAGKSTFTRWLVRTLSRGEALPDGQQLAAPVGTVWISNEETESTVISQLERIGADLTKVRILNWIEPNAKRLGESARRRFNANEDNDLDVLRQTIWDDPTDNIGLVVIDAARGMCDKSISYPKNAREVLERLNRVAEETGVPILILHHFNRGRSTRVIERIAASGEMYNFPRCVWALSPSEEDATKVILSVPKPFLADAPPSLTYKREGAELEFISGYDPTLIAEYEKKDAERLDDLILKYLKAHPGHSFSVQQLCAVTKRNYDAVAKQLQRLYRAGKISRPHYGMYCAKVRQNVQPAPAPQAKAKP